MTLFSTWGMGWNFRFS